MTRRKAFTTAAARRRADPIEWDIDGTIIRLRPSADLVAVADILDELQKDTPEGESQIKAAAEKRVMMLDVLRAFILEDDIAAFDGLEADLDFMILSQLLSDLVSEYTGQSNPTPQSS